MRAKINLKNPQPRAAFANLAAQSKRGDTLIEVMFAIAIFSLVAVLTVSMMNLGTANAEGSLELTTARHELNAQAEALRYIHSAYTAELALPLCKDAPTGEKCQQYDQIWNAITNRALEPPSSDPTEANSPANRIVNIADTLNNNDTASTGALDYSDESGNKVFGCERAYAKGVFSSVGGSGTSLLAASNAFVLNIRNLNVATAESAIRPNTALVNRIIIRANDSNVAPDPLTNDSNIKFTPTDLSARIIFHKSTNANQTTDDLLATHNQMNSKFNEISRIEGIWTVAIKGAGTPAPFYDFYIQTCWNPPNQPAPTILDTVIRLYNPEAKNS